MKTFESDNVQGSRQKGLGSGHRMKINQENLESMLMLGYVPENFTAVGVMEFLCETDQFNEHTAEILFRSIEKVEDSSCITAIFAQIVELAESHEKQKRFNIILKSPAFGRIMNKHGDRIIQYLVGS